MTDISLDQTAARPDIRIGREIAEWFSPVEQGSLDLELQPADEGGIRIDRSGDTLTIRGAVVTIRRPAQPEALAGAHKLYY